MAKHRNAVVEHVPDMEWRKAQKDRLDKDFKRDYEFEKERSERTRHTVSKYREESAERDDPESYYCEMSEKERALIKGTPAGFAGTKKSGKLRISGHPNAHQIGKRKK